MKKEHIKTKYKIPLLFLPVLLLPVFSSCSTAPKRPAEVFSIQALADSIMGRANKEADQGNYAQALILLEEAWRLAVTTDRPNLRVRVNLAKASTRFAMGQTEEAERIWRSAEREAEFSQEPMLASACRIFRARNLLLAGKADPAETLELVLQEQNMLKSDKIFYAVSWTVKGMAEKELGHFAEAEKSVMNALAIHTKGNYLEQAGYDWYLIASIRSVSGDYRGAIEALRNAINYDRRAENTFGLAMDWAAMGDVYRKLERENNATRSYRRSAEIFRAMDKEKEAKEVESRIKVQTGS